MRDGSVQSSEAGAGAEGKDQGHRWSPLVVGGRRRGREEGVIRHVEKGKVLLEGSRINQANGAQFMVPSSPPHPALHPEGNVEPLGG